MTQDHGCAFKLGRDPSGMPSSKKLALNLPTISFILNPQNIRWTGVEPVKLSYQSLKLVLVCVFFISSNYLFLAFLRLINKLYGQDGRAV